MITDAIIVVMVSLVTASLALWILVPRCPPPPTRAQLGAAARSALATEPLFSVRGGRGRYLAVIRRYNGEVGGAIYAVGVFGHPGRHVPVQAPVEIWTPDVDAAIAAFCDIADTSDLPVVQGG